MSIKDRYILDGSIRPKLFRDDDSSIPPIFQPSKM